MDQTKAGSCPAWIRWVVGFMTRFYWLVLIGAVASGYYCYQTAKQLKLDTDIVSLMPDGVLSVENLKKVIEKTGGYSNAMILAESPDPKATVRFLADLRTEILKYDWVNSAEYSEDTAIFERNKLLYVDSHDLNEIDERLTARIEYETQHLKFNIRDTPVEISIRGARKQAPSLDFDDLERKYGTGKDGEGKQRKLFQDQSGKLIILVVMPKGGTTNVAYARKVISGLEEKIHLLNPASYHPELTATLGGRVVNLVAKFDTIMRDIKSSAVWSLSAICLVIILFYRRLSSLLYIGLPLAIGFLWTFAVTELVLGGLNLITIFLVLILFGLGIDFGIHNLARYDEVRRSGGGPEQALRTMYQRTGLASLLAGLTTIAGFFSLMVTDFRAFYEFGFIAGSGVAFALLSMYLVFPALITMAERIRLYRPSKSEAVTSAFRRLPFANTTLVAGAMISVVSLVLLGKLDFENDFSKLKTSVPRLQEVKLKIREVFPLRSDKAVVFVDSLEDVKAVVEAVESIKDLGDEAGASTIEEVKSIYSLVPESEDQRQRIQVIERIHAQLLEAVRLLEDFGGQDDRKHELRKLMKYLGVSEMRPQDLPPSLQRVYTGAPGSGGYLVYIYNRNATSKLDEAQAFVDDIREIKLNGKTFYPATEAIVFVDMLNLMKKDASIAVAAVLVTVVVTLLIALRSVSQTVVVLIPVAVGFLWMLGVMAASGIKLNVFNMVVLPTVLGIGLDNGIHIYQRYREEGSRQLTLTLRTTGAAAFLTTLTTMLGFAGTLTASNLGLQSLGLVACIGLGACMVSSLTVFPAVLQWREDNRERSAAS